MRLLSIAALMLGAASLVFPRTPSFFRPIEAGGKDPDLELRLGQAWEQGAYPPHAHVVDRGSFRGQGSSSSRQASPDAAEEGSSLLRDFFAEQPQQPWSPWLQAESLSTQHSGDVKFEPPWQHFSRVKLEDKVAVPGSSPEFHHEVLESSNPRQQAGSSSQPFEPVSPKEDADAPGSPPLDLHFSDLIRVPESGHRMRLPRRMSYSRTPWALNSLRDRVAQHLQRRTELHEVVITEADLPAFSGSQQNFFQPKSQVFLIHLGTPAWYASEPRELLIRYHPKLSWNGHKNHYEATTIWSTADEGRRLVLLGILKTPKRDIPGLLRKVGVKYTLKNLDRSPDLYLVPHS